MSTSLADLLNAPSEFTYKKGEETRTVKMREPTLLESGQYQRWLESEARASAAAAIELPEEDRRQLLRDTNADIATKRFAWGGVECVKSLTTPDGIAKLMSIVCADQGVTFAIAREVVSGNLLEIARLLRVAEAEGETDPEKKALLAALLKSKGLPENFLSTSSSGSPTTPSEPPPTSAQSATSAEPNSNCST